MATQNFEPIHFTDIKDKIDDKSPLLGALFLFLLFFITFLFVYFLYVCTHRRSGSGSTTQPDQGSLARSRSRSPAGLDAVTISSLPMFSYGSSANNYKNSSPESECAICLSMFQQEEKVKVLPICHHGFHSECVDKWLRTRSSCPLCRALIRHGQGDSEIP
ncbi:RING-H2 finger protein ATL32 [Abeliophyllum distichum]|uniref:RING-type E3 ubiquitin transferase n=1 Tax=Abeliophyllum distichum TaxID=126358 RepID=A0ABD1R8W5_9LAMI